MSSLYNMVMLSALLVFVASAGGAERIESLIARIPNLSSQELMTCMGSQDREFIVDSAQFVSDDKDWKFAPRRNEYSPVLRGVVARGATSIPILCKELTNRTPTKLCVWPQASELEVDDCYDTNIIRNRRPRPQLRYVKPINATVGDVCFYLLGNIVNRRFATASDRGVNLPNISPRLIELARIEWSHTSKLGLLRSLEHDVLKPDLDRRDMEAIRRVKFYFPDEVDGLASQRLRQPMLWINANKVFASGDDQVQNPNFISPIQTSYFLAGVSDVKGAKIDRACLWAVQTAVSDGKITQLESAACFLMLNRVGVAKPRTYELLRKFFHSVHN